VVAGVRAVDAEAQGVELHPVAAFVQMPFDEVTVPGYPTLPWGNESPSAMTLKRPPARGRGAPPPLATTGLTPAASPGPSREWRRRESAMGLGDGPRLARIGSARRSAVADGRAAS
jgi:hypothetical protein